MYIFLAQGPMPRAGGHGGTSQIGKNHSNARAQQKNYQGTARAHEAAVAAAEEAGEEPPPLPAVLQPNHIDGGALLCSVVISLGMGAVMVVMVLVLTGTIGDESR